jgi:hypothetical protein
MNGHDGVAPTAHRGRTLTQPIALRDLWPFLVLGFVLLALMYLVLLDEGATTLIPGRFVHELAHDGRHLLAAPCH